MRNFRYQFTVGATLEAVNRFHSDPIALRRLTPPPVLLQLKEIEPIAEGSTAEFVLWIGPLPIRWQAKHQDVSEFGFTDVQEEGPLASWRHTHTFTPTSMNETQITEEISFSHYSGWRGILSRLLFAKANLYFLFTYRKWQTRRLLKTA